MGETGEAILVCTPNPEELLLKPLEVVRARPLELLPLCSGIICRSNLREAVCTAGLVGASGGLTETGFLFIVAPAGIGGVGIKFHTELCFGEICRPRTGDSVSSGSVTSATEWRLV